MAFAAKYPRILLELKTKSSQIDYFLMENIPSNIVCTWSLNSPDFLNHEEHFTAGLDQRIQAARKVADQGIKVGFHFHPMVYHKGWEREYPDIARKLIRRFKPEEVLFVSLGSMTLIKPVIQKLRERGFPSKILQMEMVSDPNGKMTYPDEIKSKMYRRLYQGFSTWHSDVFFYLCMETPEIWKNLFGYAYGSNEEFEKEFGKAVRRKINGT